MTFLGAYGKILQPFGFFMYRGSFYKVDEKMGMVWLVTMYTGREGVYRSLRFDCRPFCHAIEKEWLQSDGSYQLDALYRLSLIHILHTARHTMGVWSTRSQ